MANHATTDPYGANTNASAPAGHDDSPQKITSSFSTFVTLQRLWMISSSLLKSNWYARQHADT